MVDGKETRIESDEAREFIDVVQYYCMQNACSPHISNANYDLYLKQFTELNVICDSVN